MKKLWRPLSVFVLASSLLGADPFDGMWKLNLAKSIFAGPDKAPRELTFTVQEQGRRLEVSVAGTLAEGSPISYKYSVIQTGGPFEFTEGQLPPGISGMLAKRSAASHSFDFTLSQDGKIIQQSHVAVSNDGKSLLQTNKSTDAQGKSYETVEAWDRM
jgi:hypothetical protein